MYLWKPNICPHQLDVQEANVSIPQFYRNSNHFVGCWIANGQHQMKRASEMLINCQLWISCPPTHILLKVSFSCKFFEDNEAVIKMIIKGRSPTMRLMSRTHRVALDWLFDRIKLEPMIQINYVEFHA